MTLQETEEVDCDVISVRIALKELEINKVCMEIDEFLLMNKTFYILWPPEIQWFRHNRLLSVKA